MSSPFEQPGAVAIEGVNVVPEELSRAARLWVKNGNFAETGREMGIPASTVAAWSRTLWWNQEVSALRMAEQSALDARFSKILDKTLEKIETALEHGEDYYDAMGVCHKKDVPAQTLERLLHTVFDKRQLLRSLPTSISTADGKLEAMAEKLKELARMQKGGEGVVIDGAVKDVTPMRSVGASVASGQDKPTGG